MTPLLRRPGNWLSRWAVVQGTHFGYVAHGALYLATPSSNSLRKHGLGLALAAMFGLSLVGICDESENIHLHKFGAGVYFGCYDVFMLLAVLGDLGTDVPKTLKRYARDVAGVVGVLLLPLIMGRRLGLICPMTASAFPNLWPALEWTNAILIVVFMEIDCLHCHPSTVDVIDGIVVRCAAPAKLAAPLLA